MKLQEALQLDKRWQSPDGRLILCQRCADRLWAALGNDRWIEIRAEYLGAYVEGTGDQLPCHLCEMEIEALQTWVSGSDCGTMDEPQIEAVGDDSQPEGAPLDI